MSVHIEVQRNMEYRTWVVCFEILNETSFTRTVSYVDVPCLEEEFWNEKESSVVDRALQVLDESSAEIRKYIVCRDKNHAKGGKA